MNETSKFAIAYRKLGSPSFSGESTLNYSCKEYNPNISAAIKDLSDSNKGRFDEIVADGKEVKLSELPSEWNNISFVFKLSSAGSIHIYQNLGRLLEICTSINKGILPDNFFLIQEDYLYSENKDNPQIESLGAICTLIECLADLAHYHDQKSKSEKYKLIYIKEDERKTSQSLIIEPHITTDILKYKINASIPQSIKEDNINKNPNVLKERSIFRASLIEFLDSASSETEKFNRLIKEWKSFVDVYQKNLDTYVSGFSFHKAKQEVANAELSIAEQLSKVINDISGKILSIPISLAAIIGIAKTESVFESTIITFGILVAAIIICETLATQKLQFNRIAHSKEIIFSSHKNKTSQYPKDLQDYLNTAITELDKNEIKLKELLRNFRAFCWVPAITAAITHAFIYYDHLSVSVGYLRNLACQCFSYYFL